MGKAYHIVQWDTANETPESRKLQTLPWYAKRTKTDGLGFGTLRLHKERVELYCAWTLLEVVASKSPKGLRGWLVRDGKALTAEQIAFLTGFPRSIFELALAYFSGPECPWLEEADIPMVPAGSAGHPAKAPVPEESAEVPAGSAGHPAKVGKNSATDRQTGTDRQTINEEERIKGASPTELRTQFAALGEVLKELEAIPEEERTAEQRSELKRCRSLRRQIQKKQAGLSAEVLTA